MILRNLFYCAIAFCTGGYLAYMSLRVAIANVPLLILFAFLYTAGAYLLAFCYGRFTPNPKFGLAIFLGGITVLASSLYLGMIRHEECILLLPSLFALFGSAIGFLSTFLHTLTAVESSPDLANL